MGNLNDNIPAQNAAKTLRKAYRKERRLQKREKLSLPKYSLGEEIFSAVVHGVATLSAIAMYVILLVFCKRDATTLFSVHFYGISMIVLYAVSTVYHALGVNKAKKVFRILDHCTIFILISGTYAPVSLVAVGGAVGWTMFFVVAAAAVIGITLNAVNLKKFAKVFEDDDLMQTAECLFANDLNVSKTATLLYMHRNTLIYRLKKLKHITGLDLCNFYEAIVFKMLYIFYSEK